MKKPAKKQNKNKLIGLLLICSFVLVVLYIRVNINYKSSDQQVNTLILNEEYTSSALKISLQYPKGWKFLEFPNAIIIGNNQTSLDFGNNVNLAQLNKGNILIKISLVHPLQNQNLFDYIKEVEMNSSSVNIIGSKKLGGNEAIIKDVSYVVNNNIFKYRNLYIERDKKIYTISATPADSELIPVFNKILDSIIFR